MIWFSLSSIFMTMCNYKTDVVRTLHSTLFEGKCLAFRWLVNVGCLSTLHYPYIIPTYPLFSLSQ